MSKERYTWQKKARIQKKAQDHVDNIKIGVEQIDESEDSEQEGTFNEVGDNKCDSEEELLQIILQDKF